MLQIFTYSIGWGRPRALSPAARLAATARIHAVHLRRTARRISMSARPGAGAQLGDAGIVAHLFPRAIGIGPRRARLVRVTANGAAHESPHRGRRRRPATTKAGARARLDERITRALIRALSIANASLRAPSRASCEKNFRLRRTIHMRARTQRSRDARIGAQECRDCIGRTSEVKKTLEPCGFLHCGGNPPVARKISCATRAGATRCIGVTSATSLMRVVAAHFSLTRFGVFH
jgi:hypothetical protein